MQNHCWHTGSGDTHSWSNADFELARPSALFRQQEDAWHEQRRYFDSALAALGPTSKLAGSIKAAVAALDAVPDAVSKAIPLMEPVPPELWGTSVKLASEIGGINRDPGGGSQKAATVSIKIEPKSGAVVGLLGPSGATWASQEHPIGRFVYRTRAFEDGVDFYNNYQFINASFGPRVYEKLGAAGVANETASYCTVIAMHKNASAMALELSPPDFVWQRYGGPKKVLVLIRYPSVAAGLEMTFVIVNKTTTRLPEEAWVEFRPDLAPAPPSNQSISFEKIGEQVDPRDILANGSKTLHAVGDSTGVTFGAGRSRLQLISLDAGLVSPGPAAENMVRLGCDYEPSRRRLFVTSRAAPFCRHST